MFVKGNCGPTSFRLVSLLSLLIVTIYVALQLILSFSICTETQKGTHSTREGEGRHLTVLLLVWWGSNGESASLRVALVEGTSAGLWERYVCERVCVCVYVCVCVCVYVCVRACGGIKRSIHSRVRDISPT